MCNKDCWNCEYEGCINLTNQDYKRQNDFDRKELAERPKDLTRRQVACNKYNKSYKGKMARKRYHSSENYKLKNANASRKYRQEHKEECRAIQRRYIDHNREKVNARRREYYQRNKETIIEKQRIAEARRIWKANYIKENGYEPSVAEIENWQENFLRKSKKVANE